MTKPPETWRAGALGVLAAALVPLLLAAPAVAIVAGQGSDLRAAREVLQARLRRADEALVELRDMDRIRALYLDRRSVIVVLDEDRPALVALLTTVGRLPEGLQLDALGMRGSEVTLSGIASDPAALDAASATLQSEGFETLATGRREALPGAPARERFALTLQREARPGDTGADVRRRSDLRVAHTGNPQ